MSKRDELAGYLPALYDGITDMQAHLTALGAEMDTLAAGTEQMREDNFIYRMSSSMAARLEKWLNIRYDGARTLEARRQMIASHFVGQGKIGAPEIRQLVKTFTDAPCKVSFAAGVVTITITRDANETFVFSDVHAILTKRIPSHLQMSVVVIAPIEFNIYCGIEVTQYKEVEI